MYQLIALFRQPSNSQAFDEAYWKSHVPLAEKIPGVISLTVSKTVPGRDGPAKYYQIAVLNFADKESFKAAMKSRENAEAGANLMTFAKDLVEFCTAARVREHEFRSSRAEELGVSVHSLPEAGEPRGADHEPAAGTQLL